MIKVMIVDDEPFIRQGLRILINWEHYGYEICQEASNGMEALEILKNEKVDLIITDIKMPKMDGIHLIEHVREHISKEIRFIILSGFYEFDYAKKAIKYEVEDYILKPVQKEELIRILEDYKEQYNRKLEEQKRMDLTEKIVFDNYMAHLLCGILVPEGYEYIKKYLLDDQEVRYIGFEFDQWDDNYRNLPEDRKLKMQTLLYDTLQSYIGEQWYHVYFEANRTSTDYLIGFIYVKKFAEMAGLKEKDFIHKLHDVMKEKFSEKIILFIGQKVSDITMISESYKSAKIARDFQYFTNDIDIAYYDEISKDNANTEKQRIHTEVMHGLIHAIEENNIDNIMKQADAVYHHFKGWVADPDIIRINLDYLLFHLLNLVQEIDPDIDHDEIFKMINFDEKNHGFIRGSEQHIKAFSIEFANYICQLRQNTFGGVLKEVEKEITEHYMENLSLKTLSEKYYMNSAYLGQIFKKQYGIPFKDYLNNYRIERAAELLIRSNEKIYLVADAVGFNNTDYFISKFVQIKGITPLQYRKQFLQK